MSPAAQNMKTGADALGTVEKEFGSAKHENGSRHPRYRRKSVREQKSMKTGPDALDTAENEYGDVKHENMTRRPPHHRKRVMELKTLKREPTPSLPPK
jgi:hypothetical protein